MFSFTITNPLFWFASDGSNICVEALAVNPLFWFGGDGSNIYVEALGLWGCSCRGSIRWSGFLFSETLRFSLMVFRDLPFFWPP